LYTPATRPEQQNKQEHSSDDRDKTEEKPVEGFIGELLRNLLSNAIFWRHDTSSVYQI
jgi:hypothetical protein